MRSITTDAAPTPGGHYSQAMVHGGFVFVAGQLPIEPTTGKPATDGPIEDQTRLVLANLAAILAAAGSSLASVVKTTIYVADISLWGRVNATYAEVFGDHKPARAVVPTRELHFGALLELDAIAVVDPGN